MTAKRAEAAKTTSALTRDNYEKIKFRHFIQTIVWVKTKTGKPYSEVTNTIMHLYKMGILESYS